MRSADGQDPVRNEIHVCLSGGGTRAALASGGAILGLLEAQEQGKADVVSITAVSGSAIMVTRLLIAGDDVPPDTSVQARIEAARAEVWATWRHGFRQAMWRDFIVVSALGFAGALVIRTLNTLNGVEPPLPGSHWAFGVLIAGGAEIVGRRLMPFNAMHPTRVWQWIGKGLAQHRWLGHERVDRCPPLLPTTSIGFTTTDLTNLEPALHSPWTAIPVEGPSDLSNKTRHAAASGLISVGDLAKASAAVPIHSRWVMINGNRHVDGGVLDNLGVGHVAERIKPGGRLLVVDASAPDKQFPPPQRRLATTGLRSAVRYYSLVLAVSLGGAATTGLALQILGREELVGASAAVWTIVIIVAAMRPTTGFLAEGIAGGREDLSTEARALKAIQKQQARLAYESVSKRQIELDIVKLPNHESFDRRPDFRTKLTRVEPATGQAIVLHSYRETCRALAVDPSPQAITEIEGWHQTREAAGPSRGLARLTRVGTRALRTIFFRSWPSAKVSTSDDPDTQSSDPNNR